MAQNEPTPNRGGLELSDDRARAVDEAGRRAGAALRSPAPADGAAAIRGRAHRRRVVRAGAATAMVGVLLAGVMALSSRDGSGDVQPADTPTDTVPETGPTASAATPEPTTKSTTPVSTTPVPTTPVSTTPDSTSAPSTVETTSANPPAPTGSLEVVEVGMLDGSLPRYSPDGSLLATVGADVRIHDSATLTQLRELPCPTSLESLPASAGTGPGLDFVWNVAAAARWDADSFTVLTSVGRSGLCDVTVSTDGTRAVTVADVQRDARPYGRSLLWDTSNGSLVALISGTPYGFSTDGSRLFMSNGPTFSMLDSSTGAVVRTITDDADGTASSPDGSRLLRWGTTTDADGTTVDVTIYETQTLTPVATLSAGSPDGAIGIEDPAFEDPVFDDTSGRVAALHASGVAIWDSSTGAKIRHVSVELVNGRSVAFSPGGAMIALRNGSHITIFDSTSGAQLADLDADTTISDVMFSPDGVSLAAEFAGSTRVWSYRRTD